MQVPMQAPVAAVGFACLVALAACSTVPVSVPTSRAVPPTDCHAWVGADRNAELPGYLLPQPNGTPQCVPLLLTANEPPAGYRGDFHVDEFTDTKLKARWAACKADAAMNATIRAGVLESSFMVERRLRATGMPVCNGW